MTIKRDKNTWKLMSKDGTKKLGTFATKREAVKREKQIVYFKNRAAGKIKK
jgi:hypothetical protein